jgi:hypothetical protein
MALQSYAVFHSGRCLAAAIVARRKIAFDVCQAAANLLWVAKQHGHSVEVMLRMYAAWLEGATAAEIQAIKKAMKKGPDARAAFLDSRSAISAVNTVSNRVTQIVIRP